MWRLELGDQVMQDASTNDLLFDIPALVSAASQNMPLLPGDLRLIVDRAPREQIAEVAASDEDALRPAEYVAPLASDLRAQRRNEGLSREDSRPLQRDKK